jgi:hypothetical protein
MRERSYCFWAMSALLPLCAGLPCASAQASLGTVQIRSLTQAARRFLQHP